LLRKAFPDHRIDVDDTLVDGDKIAVQWTFSGTHRGSFAGVAPTGKRVLQPGIDVFRLVNRTIVERWTFMNLLSLFQQLDSDFVHEQHGRALQRLRLARSAVWARYLHKVQVVKQALTDEHVLNCFRRNVALPLHYGLNVDERCVEYPWLLTRLRPRPGTLLDAGSTLNHKFVLDYPAFRDKTIHIMTLGPERNCFWHKGISYLFGDLRDIPIRDNFYETIVCASVLEHIGFDNKLFIKNDVYRENSSDAFILVMKEFHRLLKPGGELLLTVPFGTYQHHGWFQQFDAPLLNRAIRAFSNPHQVAQTFYRSTPDGWVLTTAEECAGCEYGRGAVAACAVACVQVVK
jgi:hypothetical protein